jgi:uncharacterized protein
MVGMSDDDPARPPRPAGGPVSRRLPRERDAEGRPANARPRDRFGAPLPRGAVDEMPDREEPEDVVADVPEALDRAVALFDAQRFFEAHEFLEWIWKHPSVDPADRDFWKGVTQVAVGGVHTQRGNATGALTLLSRAAAHLDRYPTPHHGIATATLAAAARRLADAVRTEGAHPEHTFPSFPR